MSEFFINLIIVAGFEFHIDIIDTLLVYHKKRIFSGNMVIDAFPSLNRWLIQKDEISNSTSAIKNKLYVY